VATKRDTILEAAVGVIARRGVRGLRVEEIAADAGVSLGLIYYHFRDRAGLLEATFAHVHERAAAHNEAAREAGRTSSQRLTLGLLAELDDTPASVEWFAAWNELRASAFFEASLREPVRTLTETWTENVALRIALAITEGDAHPRVDPQRAAERLTTLVEGLGARWLSGSMTAANARLLLAESIEAELGAPPGLD
jgi:AcrR family transcriptional regulator